MTLANDIATYLQTNGHGTKGTDLFADYFRASPENQIIVIPWNRERPLAQIGSDNIDRPGLQIQVRNTSLTTAESKAAAIKTLLTKRTDVPGCTLVDCLSSHPDYMGSENNLHRFRVDFAVIV